MDVPAHIIHTILSVQKYTRIQYMMYAVGDARNVADLSCIYVAMVAVSGAYHPRHSAGHVPLLEHVGCLSSTREDSVSILSIALETTRKTRSRQTHSPGPRQTNMTSAGPLWADRRS